MPAFADRQDLPYRVDQLFDLVADVEKYPEFLPWCAAARVRSRSVDELTADLTIGFGPFRESFSSRVALDRPRGMVVRYENGPFRYLTNRWNFSPIAGGCVVDFHVDFEFRSRALQAVIGVVFEEAVRRMVGAFHARARDIYGPASDGAVVPALS
ncbi:MAG: type II toxin-antitoxin system RatA family toxin [Acetobacteraceae bacterium]|nr:type II toxin-antitoxin system RatA family toxin [Acetobacteraceae bacterium]MSP29509.1 type II toxin-antitoxin system RatA family toxin [Acetobacteraceae bacterium]